MTRLYEIAALAYGLFAMTLITGVALWLGDRSAALLMVGCVCAAYVCQVAAAIADRPDNATEAQVYTVALVCASIAWAASILFALAAIAHMVLA
jgi:hypothetical protein